MIKEVPVRFEGPDFFCPDCKRRLVHVHDGMADLSARVSILSRIHRDWYEDMAEALVVSATCDRAACRVKRSLRDGKLRVARRLCVRAAAGLLGCVFVAAVFNGDAPEAFAAGVALGALCAIYPRIY